MYKYAVLFSIMLISNSLTANYLNRETEYDKEFVQAIEIAYGDGYLSSGGKQTVERIFKNISLDGKKILDFGCGVGGPSLYLAQKHSAHITAVDVEPYVISIAEKKKREITHYKGSVDFKCIKPEELLPFEDNHFDIVYASESILHVQNKVLLFSEFYRILQSGGTLIINDWLHSSSDYSNQMRDFLQADGLTFHLITPQEYISLLIDSGFKAIVRENTSHYTLQETRDILNQLDGALGKIVCETYNESYLNEYKESWALQALVFEQEEMLTYVFMATK